MCDLAPCMQRRRTEDNTEDNVRSTGAKNIVDATIETINEIASFLEIYEVALLRISSSQIDQALMEYPLDLFHFGEMNLNQIKKFRTSSLKLASLSADIRRRMALARQSWDLLRSPNNFKRLSWKIIGINYSVLTEAELAACSFDFFSSVKFLTIRLRAYCTSESSDKDSEEDVQDDRALIDLENIARLEQLEILDMSSIPIGGDLATVSHLVRLESLSLRNTFVFGKLASLMAMNNIVEISLRNTFIDGELESISNLTGVRFIDMGYTNVSGDLKSLSKLLNLQHLYLSGTKVSGRILNLIGLSQIKTLHIIGTLVRITPEEEATFLKSRTGDEDENDFLFPMDSDFLTPT